MQRFCRLFFATGLCFISFCNPANAQDGAFDTTFASSGREVFNISPSKQDLAMVVRETANGKLLIAGSCNDTPCLARLNPDGSLDQTYGPTKLGYFRLDQIGLMRTSDVNDMILMPDGRAVVLACNEGFNSIYMVKTDGSDLDTSSAGGKGYNDFAASFCAARIRRQTDGKFDVAGQVAVSGYGNGMSVQRIDADLTGLDASFGSNGTAVVAFGVYGTAGYDSANALAIQSDGKIVVGGYGGDGEGKSALALARLLSDGQLDTSFGNGDGRLHYPGSAPRSSVLDLVIDSQQRVVFAGYIQDSGNENRLVGRLTSAGKFDATFGITGLGEYPFANSGDASANSLTLSGQSIIIGSSVPSATGNPIFLVSRISSTGHLDVSFGDNGTTSAPFSSSEIFDYPGNVIVTSRGIVITGYASTGSTYEFGVARLTYEYIFSDSFE